MCVFFCELVFPQVYCVELLKKRCVDYIENCANVFEKRQDLKLPLMTVLILVMLACVIKILGDQEVIMFTFILMPSVKIVVTQIEWCVSHCIHFKSLMSFHFLNSLGTSIFASAFA